MRVGYLRLVALDVARSDNVLAGDLTGTAGGLEGDGE